MYENSESYDDGQQETNCGVSVISSPHVSNNSSSCSSSSNSEDESNKFSNRKITKQHKHSPSKKKKRSLIGEIVMNSQPIQTCSSYTTQQPTNQQTIVFEQSFEGRKSSSNNNSTNHIPGTFSFSHKVVENSQLSNSEQGTPAKSNMCEVILSNWKSRSDTRQWIKKCIGPQDKKKKVKNQSSNSQLSNSPQFCQSSPTVFNQQIKFDTKQSNSISTSNIWADSYVHTTCLIPGQRKVSKSSGNNNTQQSMCYQLAPQSPTISHQAIVATTTKTTSLVNPWLNMNSTSNVLSEVSDKQFALPSFREFVSTLGL